jgi:hypothetical protein
MQSHFAFLEDYLTIKQSLVVQLALFRGGGVGIESTHELYFCCFVRFEINTANVVR